VADPSHGTGTANKREAKQVHDRLAAARWEQDRLGAKPRHTWEEAVVRWLLETKHKATHEADKAKLRWLDPHLGGRFLDEVDRTLVDRIKFEREKIGTAGTTNRYLALIRSILRRASDEWDWLEKVPRVKLFQEPEGRIRALTPDEFERLIKELPEHLADMAVFSVATGLRQANVKGLQWQYVDLGRRHAWIPGSQHKNRRPHAVPLNELALECCASSSASTRLGCSLSRSADRGGEHEGLASRARAGRHRRLSLARPAAHVCHLAPSGRHADPRAAAARRLADRLDGRALRPRGARGAGDRSRTS
jgi:integrase